MEDLFSRNQSEYWRMCVWGEQGEDIRQIAICATNICLFKLEEKKPPPQQSEPPPSELVK